MFPFDSEHYPQMQKEGAAPQEFSLLVLWTSSGARQDKPTFILDEGSSAQEAAVFARHAT